MPPLPFVTSATKDLEFLTLEKTNSSELSKKKKIKKEKGYNDDINNNKKYHKGLFVRDNFICNNNMNKKNINNNKTNRFEGKLFSY